jgi:nucleoside-diphosphate-sugar epimerase
MAVLLIGGGLVGSQIANILLEQGEDVSILDYAHQPEALRENVDTTRIDTIQGDVLNPMSIMGALRNTGAKRVVHTAAYPMLTIGGQQNPYGTIQINIMGTANVLEASRTMGVERLVVVSSAVLTSSIAGGQDGGVPAREEAFPRPTTFYAATKQAVESLSLNYAAWCDLDVRAVRYAAIAGPWSGRGGGGPSNTFRSLVESALLSGEVEVPARSMEWVYSKDAARGTVLALEADDIDSRVFNIGTGRITTPEDFADAIAHVLPETRTSISDSAQERASSQTLPLNLDRARKLLGYEPRFDTEGAVRDYVDWYTARKSNV